MATIKSYTDISQSRKLAEFLPLESADMEYMFLKKDGSKVSTVPFVKEDNEPEWPDDNSYDYIPVWSLASLLEILPDGTDVVKNKADTKEEKYMCTVGIKNDIMTTFANNPIDACYDMIIKLSELNLL